MTRLAVQYDRREEARFNPTLLTLARESQRLRQSDLATAAGVSQGTISKLENGQWTGGDEVLKAIAKVLDYEPSLFFEHFATRELPLFFHRKRKALSVLDLRCIHATIEILRLQVAKLLKSVEVPENRVPYIDLEREGLRPADVAKQVRIHWGLPRGPVENMAATLESAGVIIVFCDFGSRLIDGLSVFNPMDSMPPLIVLNSRSPAERTRWTAAHELGHLICHYHQALPAESTEDEANEFAAEFLMPASDIRGHLGSLSLDDLVYLKPQWKVSMGALLVHAHRLGRITPHRYKTLQIRMSSLGYRTREPNELPPEKASVLREIVGLHEKELSYSDAEMAKLVHLPVERFRAVFKGEVDIGVRLRLLPST